MNLTTYLPSMPSPAHIRPLFRRERYEQLLEILLPDVCFGFFAFLGMGGEARKENVRCVRFRDHLDFFDQEAGLTTQEVPSPAGQGVDQCSAAP